MKFSLSLGRKSVASGVTVVGAWWRHHVRSVFFLLFLLVAAAGILSWYWSLFLFHWTGTQEEEYRRSKSTQTVFREDRFQSTLDAIRMRRERYQVDSEPVRDLFFGSK